MIIPEDLTGVQVTMWCSLFCTGNPATGELKVKDGEGWVGIPVCEECRDRAMTSAGTVLDTH